MIENTDYGNTLTEQSSVSKRNSQKSRVSPSSNTKNNINIINNKNNNNNNNNNNNSNNNNDTNNNLKNSRFCGESFSLQDTFEFSNIGVKDNNRIFQSGNKTRQESMNNSMNLSSSGMQ